jgi:hypothetical protein
MKLPLTRVELDPMRCHCGKCANGELFINQKCHPAAHCEVVYNQKTGILTVRCAQCKQVGAQIKVASTLLDV